MYNNQTFGGKKKKRNPCMFSCFRFPKGRQLTSLHRTERLTLKYLIDITDLLVEFQLFEKLHKNRKLEHKQQCY